MQNSALLNISISKFQMVHHNNLLWTCPLLPAGSASGGKRLAKAERLGLEPRRHLRVDRLAICSVTTPAPLLNF